MKVIFYVNTDNYNLYTKEEFNEILKNTIETLAKDQAEFEEYLNRTYTSSEAFQLTDDERAYTMLDFKDNWCLKRAEEILLGEEEYVLREVEI